MITRLGLKRIIASPYQVRAKMNGQPLEDLKASMSEIGLAVPIKVRPVPGKGHEADLYETVYGHRRMEAARQLGWEQIDVVVEDLDDEQAMLQGLAENIQRDDLEPMDEARAYERLQDEFGWEIGRISKETGKSEKSISYYLKLVDEPKEIQKLLVGVKASKEGTPEGRITLRHTLAVGALNEDPDRRKAVLKKAAKENMTTRQTEMVAKAIKAAPTEKIKKHLLETEYDEFTHDPKRIEEIAEKRGSIDPTIRRPPKIKIWEKAVASFLRYIKQMRVWVDAFEKSVDADQLSPEAKPFVAERLKTLRNEIDRVLKKLEE